MALHTLLKRLEIPRETDVQTKAYMNRDTRPLPLERRTYGPWEFVGLWVVTGAFNVGGWMTGSSVIALGLNVWQAMLTVIIGNILVGIICVLTGAPGSKWHIGFSILQKASWGMYGALFPLVQRIMLSFIWYSTQIWWGGQCTKTFLTALWPSFRNLNTPLAHGTMDTGDFTAFIVFWSLCLPLIWVPPEKYKIPFAIAACSVAPTVLALMIWCTAQARGAGPLVSDISVAGVEQARGSHLGWMLVLGICTNIGGISTHIFSQSDFTRFARRPGDQFLSQLLFVPLSTVSVALIGILCTSCASQLFPETNGTLLWEPYRLLATVQTHFDDSPRARVAVAFASLAFVVAQFGISVAENALSNGIDLSALLPRYFNLRRGGYLTAVFAFVMQPWELMNGASNFLTVMGGYGVFLGSMTGVMFSDYYMVRQRRLMLTGLYDASSTSIYWYWSGVNWRAPVAWVAATWLLLPGFVRRVQDPTAEWSGWSHLYYMSWPLGCFLAMLFYYLLARAFPVPQPQAVDDADYFDTFGLANDSVSVLEGEVVSGNGSLAKKDQAVLSSEEMNRAV
ncbi:probable uracil permease [Fusarium fujikuroi IMI 58289]|uniref:Probable uracil permease n=1 Tax=Gibberella fujikuroi (strain CBS 195.34 / IMI 58289 / NRRL A-6831) TaxID=1279085 RepID=S0EMW1_GIBF5|nr:probable uracil permease [Fusarium fujikuroi IMI 58289]KLO99685.1 putative uracil permease [Fusarium fujikuroi]CCT76156.1 probable uracil permease [Fusarium fujikuroi IMI 58289]SCO26827.1 probable uracil permease [Fusarium fujikuroi]SCO58677.1 probable uracil permease [Fusarium fujikuroi]